MLSDTGKQLLNPDTVKYKSDDQELLIQIINKSQACVDRVDDAIRGLPEEA